MIPSTNDGKFLPSGVYDATWQEVQDCFGNGERRRQFCARMSQLILKARACGYRALYLFGSFISAKPEPGDIDMMWVFSSEKFATMSPQCLELVDYALMKESYGWDSWCSSDDETVLAMMIEGWQKTRDPNVTRGIIRVDLERFEGLII